MANSLLSEKLVETIAREVLPGCHAAMEYRGTWDDFALQVNYGEEVTQILLSNQTLALSSNDFSDWLKSELPSEWFPKMSTDAYDFDATG